ncbi:MAG: transcriptional regulator, AraC family [Clostridia bacterium]|jgi:AraC-like DNA-binding protein|nr:transcriptional regulator, AraC family [Clostridia bacterium]
MNGIFSERRVYKDIIITHSHDFGQLVLPISGSVDIITEHKNFGLDDQHLFFLPPSNIHTFKFDKPNESLVLDIPNYMLNDNDMTMLKDGIELSLDEKWKAIRFLLLSELKDNSNSGESLLKLYHYFSPLIFENVLPASVKYMHEHYNENINLQDLADIEHYHFTYYSEWFKKSMGVSPTEYIQKLRVQRAKELLRNTDLNLIRIANEVGYNHNSSLTRVFKLHEKTTPLDYRMKIRKTDK